MGFCPVIEFIVSKFVSVDGTLVKISVTPSSLPPWQDLVGLKMQIEQSPPQSDRPGREKLSQGSEDRKPRLT